METFRTRKDNIFVSDLENQWVHVDFYPDNMGIQDTIMLGAEIEFKGKTIEQAITDYEEIARTELFEHIEKIFPNIFSLN